MTDIVQALRQGSLSKDDYRWEAADEIERLRAEVKTWINHTKNAVWSDSEECKLLTAEVEKLRAALDEAAFDMRMSLQIDKQTTAEIERLRAALKRVLDSGLLFGPTAMHDEIKAIAHAALGGEP